MRVTSLVTSSFFVFVLGVSACTGKALDIGHDTPDGGSGSGSEAGSGDAAATTSNVTTDGISCPYDWSISPASPLDVCCKSTNGGCAVLARGDRPYTCSTTPDGCGCAFGGGGHRYELRCNQLIGCSCLVDGLSSIDPTAPLPYTCDGTGASMDRMWRDTCKFPDATNVGPSAPCPFGLTQSSRGCCSGTYCRSPLDDTPFSCSGGPKGCGCVENLPPHQYAMKCTGTECICAVNGYAWTTQPANGVCGAGEAAMTTMWNIACQFPPH